MFDFEDGAEFGDFADESEIGGEVFDSVEAGDHGDIYPALRVHL